MLYRDYEGSCGYSLGNTDLNSLTTCVCLEQMRLIIDA